ncbi:SIMPL domain-containing protein [Antrihabitans cavernicola]|uniref:SIMPL domain-containing protein n=1 Tax=Antrihabitans cavernicola TaxID=2495913 RepID=A0A5A7S8M8_9NOCA|nr:SIMPL domain-containing protein [Spelaeibacter cavernicola]KAA0022490.1 SIMPL domain-containing protein [Spelaeibacter cavernicola]
MSSSPVEITVAGRAEVSYQPERCTVHLRLGFESERKATAHSATAALLADLQKRIRKLYDATKGPVNWWSADQLRNSQHRPFNQDGKQLPFVYSSAVTVEVKFSDLSAVGSFVEQLGEVDGVNINRLEWALTSKSRDGYTQHVRDLAVRDAVAKATTYARSLGLGTVSPLAIADPGLLGRGAVGGAPVQAARFMSAKAGGGGDLEMKPDYIELAADVEARFEAR